MVRRRTIWYVAWRSEVEIPRRADFVEYSFESDGSHFISRYPGEAFPDTGVGYGERTGTVHGKPYQGQDHGGPKRQGSTSCYTVVSEQGEDEKFTFRRVQDEQVVSPAYEHLKDLEDFIGNWVAEETLNEDMPGLAKKGETVTYRASVSGYRTRPSCNWILPSRPPMARPSTHAISLAGTPWNKKIVYSGFDTDGGRDWGTLKKESPDKWIWESNWCGADGTQGSGMDTTTMLDDNNTHVHEYTNGMVDGKPQPDRKVVYKRVK